MKRIILLLWLASCALPPGADERDEAAEDGCDTFVFGVGKSDVTGPIAELGMMGYGMLAQKTAGLRTRLWARAFVVQSPCGGGRLAFVNLDVQGIEENLRHQVVERLRHDLGDVYSEDQIVLSAIHNHSGPGGYYHHALYNLTIPGFDALSFQALLDGTVEAIERAHASRAPGTIRMAQGDLFGASVNRSPEAYARNPAAERARYATDVDPSMTVLSFERDGRSVATLNWFAVHGTSMGNDNRLVTGDNKGLAEQWLERQRGGGFVAAFAQSNEGDASPNVRGGQDGGGADDFESTEIAARAQLDRAVGLLDGPRTLLHGPVDVRHAFVKMDEVVVAPGYADGTTQTTCPGALGLQMIAGAEDGPGFGREGMTCDELPGLLPGLVCEDRRTECQGDKRILLETGTIQPVPWTPSILPLQVARIGDLALVAVPFELTTMAGRRLRATLEARLRPVGVDRVVIAGLSNAYAGYVTTREEYAHPQHYEGASTHFGPWTLAAIQQETDRLATALATGQSIDRGPAPPDLRDRQIDPPIGEVVFDAVPIGRELGQVIDRPAASYGRGETVRASFWGAHPRNDLRRNQTYLVVQRLTDDGWATVATDDDWETTYRWERDHCVPTFACSRVSVEWTIPSTAAAGTYRIGVNGEARRVTQQIRTYWGATEPFEVR